MTEHHILEGDVMDGLRTLPDARVQCTVTSPPYWMLRNYGVTGQIGLEETMDGYIKKMVEVFHEVKRVTRNDGILWLNLGDCYSGSGKGPTGKNGLQQAERRMGFDKSDSNRGCKKYNLNGGSVPEGLKAKDLMGIPWRVAFALQADGWYFRSAIPWVKRNCMPESATDRPTSAIEYIFLMAKSAKYFYDGEAVRCPVSGGTHARGTYKGDLPKTQELGKGIKQNSSWTKACWAQPEGTGKKKKTNKQDATGNPTYTGFNERYNNVKMARNGSNVPGHSGNSMCDGVTRNYRNSDPFFESWQGLYSESDNPLAFVINPQARPELHFATFPDLLAETCIKAGTSERGCCPKCGSPYQRIVEASGGKIGESWHPHNNDEVTGQVGFKSHGYKREQKRWEPGCTCDAGDTTPCLVLDPFMGSGTVAVVARNLNRSSVGCELNPDYVKIIRKRLQINSQLDTGVIKYLFEKVPQ